MNVIFLRLDYDKDALNSSVEKMNQIVDRFKFSSHISSIEYINR